MAGPMFDTGEDRLAVRRPLATLTTYTDYQQARSAVDALSDAGFDVSSVEIVWHGLSRVERVTGRRTVGSAALEGAGAGAWFGAFLGLLSAIFIEVDGVADGVAVVMTYVLIGSLVGATWFGMSHWSTGGRRDFASYPLLVADTYEVRVDPERRGEAATILGVSDSRPTDPPPARP